MTTIATTPSPTARRVGLVLTVLVGLFLAFDVVIHVLDLDVASEAMTELGYPAGSSVVVGLIELVCLALYLAPRTAPLGAVLLTGYLGGAVATHLRAESPLLSTMLFPVYTGVVVWLALYLRDARVRALAEGVVRG